MKAQLETPSYRLNTRKPQLWALILLISFPSVGAVLISPALPAISDAFHISNGSAQQLITIFVIGYALGQLIYSPIANRFGRKHAAFIGITVYLLSCGLCLGGIYIHNLGMILFGRLFMALGASVGMVISFTMINDYYYPQQARSIISYTVLAYAFMPAVAISLGGYITAHLSWVDCFYFYLFYGCFIFIITTFLPETLQHKKLDALQLKPLLKSYASAFSCKRLIFFSFIYGLMSAYIYIIASGAPFIGIDYLKLSPSYYGILLLAAYAGQLLGSLISGSLSKWMSPYKVMTLGYCCVIAGILFMLISFASHWVTSFTLIFPIAILMLGLPMVYSTVTVKALSEYDDKATGSATMSFITMTVALIGNFVLTLLPTRYPITLPLLFVAVILIAIIAFFYALRRYQD
jgi:predicted MFS family arabinose efflux permease